MTQEMLDEKMAQANRAVCISAWIDAIRDTMVGVVIVAGLAMFLAYMGTI